MSLSANDFSQYTNDILVHKVKKSNLPSKVTGKHMYFIDNEDGTYSVGVSASDGTIKICSDNTDKLQEQINVLNNGINKCVKTDKDSVIASGARLKFAGPNNESGIAAGNGDGADFTSCNLDLFSWTGIGMYPTTGGAWGDGPTGRSIVFNPRDGNIFARGAVYVGEWDTKKKVATEEQIAALQTQINNLKAQLMATQEMMVSMTNS